MRERKDGLPLATDEKRSDTECIVFQGSKGNPFVEASKHMFFYSESSNNIGLTRPEGNHVDSKLQGKQLLRRFTARL